MEAMVLFLDKDVVRYGSKVMVTERPVDEVGSREPEFPRGWMMNAERSEIGSF